MSAYYNEHDPRAAAWLRELIRQGHIAPGEVDERSIEDVRPDDLRPYQQCHFFAGIGVWSLALRRAGWPDDRRVWTGSCPCQPFSAAGKGNGFADERHLWPAWFQLIAQCRPARIYGEQVAIRDGLAWLDLVLADLEGAYYAAGAVDLCAAGFGAPHIRQRLYFVADAERGASERQRFDVAAAPRGTEGEAWEQRVRPDPGAGRDARELADADLSGLEGRQRTGGAGQCAVGPHGVADAAPAAGPTNGHWRDADWLLCRDGRWRPVEPGTSPLVDGAPARVGLLRGYGNAIVAQVAEAFVRASMEVSA